MDPVLPVHIAAGAVSIIAGFVALYASKGAPLHRRAGMVFVYVMFTMTLSGFVLAIVRNAAPEMNIPAAIVTAYLVATALTTVRPPGRGARALHVGLMLVAFGVTAVSLVFGFQAVAGGGMRNDIPAFPFFLFAFFAIMGGVGDLRQLRSGAPTGADRIGRHLWRMGLALFIATMSFFLGQSDEIPKSLRHPVLLAAPIIAVLVTMLYWLWRVRIRRSFRGVVRNAANEAV